MGHGLQNYLKSGYLPELTPAAVEAIVENFDGENVSMMWFQHLGGPNRPRCAGCDGVRAPQGA